MKLRIEKELFQWEKNRFDYVETSINEPEITYVQFYNGKAAYGPEVPLKEGKAQIPNYLLRENLPIMAVACVGSEGDTQAIARREFRVLKRAKPEFYFDEDDTSKDVIYDGGEEI